MLLTRGAGFKIPGKIGLIKVSLITDYVVKVGFVMVQILMFFECKLLSFFMSFNEIWGYQMIVEKKTQKNCRKAVDSDNLK